MENIKILRSNAFKKAYKKLHANQQKEVDTAIHEIVKNPEIGESKKGDLSGIFVYKFSCVRQQFLLAYEYDRKTRTLLALGVHENFYRMLKSHRNTY